MKVQKLNRSGVLLFLIVLLFMYPYGLTVAGGNFRIPDLLAVPVIALSLITIAIRKKIYYYPLLLSAVVLFILAEILYPIAGVVVGYDGLGGIANAARMMFIWLPFFIYTISSHPNETGVIEPKINKILCVAIIINICYGIVQLGVRAAILPDIFLITRMMEPFAVDEHFRVQDGFRASGFFTNTSTLSIFSVVTLSYFFSKYIFERQKKDGLFAILGFVLVLMTLSRTAIFTAVFVILVGWLFLNYKTKVITLFVFSGVLIAVYFIVDNYIGVDILFNRIVFIFEYGLADDSSFGARINEIWPAAIQKMQAYPIGTLSSPSEKVGLIDSGYLTYYAQGRWLFIGILIAFLISILLRGVKSFSSRRSWATVMILSLSLYIIASMAVLNPLKSPIIIYFLLFGVWVSDAEVLFRKNRKYRRIID